MRVKDTKADATGRSTGKVAGRQGRINRPPKGEAFVWLNRDLLASASWRLQSINCRRLIDALLLDHMAHAGTENGNLMATYDQLVEFGAGRRHIRRAIEEAEYLGLIRYSPGGRWAGTNQPSRFRLTFYADKDGTPPTNEWKSRTEEEIKNWKSKRAELAEARRSYSRKQNAGSLSCTTVVH